MKELARFPRLEMRSPFAHQVGNPQHAVRSRSRTGGLPAQKVISPRRHREHRGCTEEMSNQGQGEEFAVVRKDHLRSIIWHLFIRHVDSLPYG
jgi:hypothetical protein